MQQKLSIIFLGGLLSAICCLSAAPSSRSKTKYLGEYQNVGNTNYTSDTLMGILYMTSDSFTIIYQLKADTDYALPMYRGTWDVVNDTLLELKQPDITTRAVFHAYEQYKTINTGKYQFTQRMGGNR